MGLTPLWQIGATLRPQTFNYDILLANSLAAQEALGQEEEVGVQSNIPEDNTDQAATLDHPQKPPLQAALPTTTDALGWLLLLFEVDVVRTKYSVSAGRASANHVDCRTSVRAESRARKCHYTCQHLPSSTAGKRNSSEG